MSIYNVIDRIWDTRNFNVGGGAASLLPVLWQQD